MPTPAVPQIVRLPADLAALVAGPDFGGRPACAGRAPLHDDQVHGEPEHERAERHQYAAAVCGRCPVKASCAAAAAELGPRKAVGIWAGRLHEGPTDPRHSRRTA